MFVLDVVKFRKMVPFTAAILSCITIQALGWEIWREGWDHCYTLDLKEHYDVCWSVEKDTITFQLEVATEGTIGFGLSPSGSYAKSNILITWVKRDRGYLQVYNVKENGMMKYKPNNSWKLLSATENGTHSIIKLSRKLDTCDPDEWVISDDTRYLMYAYNDYDPDSPDTVPFKEKMWKSTPVRLEKPRFKKIPMPDDVKIWDVRVKDFAPPGNKSTFYACTLFKAPPMKRKHHIIKAAPAVRPERESLIHHLVLFRCIVRSKKDIVEAMSRGTTECYTHDSPDLYWRCTDYLIAWGRGGGPLVLPSHMGATIGESYPEYYLLQMHYDNPTFIKGIVDSSGFRIYYTPKLREHDSAFLFVGIPLLSFIVLPPHQDEFILAGHASPQCLSQAVPKEGIHLSVVLPHGHLQGRQVRLRHFRKNKELPNVVADMYYTHFYQEYVYKDKDILFLPGDQLIAECTYDTSKKNKTTVGGASTNEEMCAVFIVYHPPIRISAASSAPTLETIAGVTGMELSTGKYSVSLVRASPDYAFKKYMNKYKWNPTLACIAQQAFRYSPQRAFCVTTNNSTLQVPYVSYPDHLIPYNTPDKCMRNNKSSSMEEKNACPFI